MAIKLTDFLKVPLGAAKKVISYPSKAAQAGQDLAQSITRSEALKPLTQAFGQTIKGGIQESTGLSDAQIASLAQGARRTLQKGAETPEILKPKGTAENIGGFLGDIGVAIATAPATGGLSSIKGVGSASKALNLAKTVGAEAGVGATLGAAQEGTASGALTGGLLGAAVPAVGAIGRGAKTVAMETLGKLTGAGADALEGAFSNPKVMQLARTEQPEELQERALDFAKKSLRSVADKRREDYLKDLAKVKINTTDLTNELLNTRQKIVKDLNDKYGIEFIDGKGLNDLDFGKSTVVSTKAQRLVKAAVNDVLGWTDNTAIGLDTLKKRIGDYMDQAGDNRLAMSILAPIKSDINQTLVNTIPEYANMTGEYARVSGFMDEVTKALSLGNKTQKDTAIRKLMSVTRQNNEYRKSLLDSLGAQTGKDIKELIQAAQLTSITPRGLVGQGASTLIGLGTAILNPQALPATLGFLLTGSPRVVGETLSILGKVKGKVIPKAQRDDIARLFLRAAQELEQTVTVSQSNRQSEQAQISPDRLKEIQGLTGKTQNIDQKRLDDIKALMVQ